jgi:hypothetical protein
MRKTILTGAAAAAVLAGALGGTAHAQCAWTGYDWNCTPPAYSYSSSYPSPYDWWTGGFGYYGTAEQYASSRNGPDPGGGFRHMGRSNVGHTD